MGLKQHLVRGAKIPKIVHPGLLTDTLDIGELHRAGPSQIIDLSLLTATKIAEGTGSPHRESLMHLVVGLALRVHRNGLVLDLGRDTRTGGDLLSLFAGK